MARILIVYYSRTGNTEKMAQLVADGAKKAGAEVTVKKVQQTTADDLTEHDALIFGSPTYYGTMAWEMKKLIDDSVKYHGKLDGKVGAAFSSSGNLAGGNETTVLSILKAFLIHGMIVQGDAKGDHYGPVAVGAPDDRSSTECRRLGERVAALAKKIAS
jgi:NAD(P)H dehydrogenase (quinone)